MKNRLKETNILNYLFLFSLVTYFLVLCRASLFKYVHPLELFDVDRYRICGINLIPFNGSGLFFLQDIVINILLYVPFGFFIAMKNLNKRFLLVAFGISFILECLQYILQLGTSDITDFINNCLGSCFGFIFYITTLKLLKNKEKLDKFYVVVISIIACVSIILLY